MTEVTSMKAGLAESKQQMLNGWTGTLHGKKGSLEITVPPASEWIVGALENLTPDVRTWGEWLRLAVGDEVYQEAMKIQPTYETLSRFIVEREEATGEDLGESSASE